MTDLTKSFDTKAAAPTLMSPATYQATLEKLLGAGQGYGKTEGVGAYLMQDIDLVTETSSGEDETAKTLKVDKFYVVLDSEQYPSTYLRDLVIKDIARNWGGKVVKERDLQEPDFKGPGLWTIKQNSFEFDYVPEDATDAKCNTYKPNVEAYRVTLTTDDTIKIPVQWGDFVVEAGGTLAIRERDVADLADALQSIRDGAASAEEALYTTDDDGKTVARFDIYGMEPGFLEENYAPVALKPETEATKASFAAAPKGAPKAPKGPTA